MNWAAYKPAWYDSPTGGSKASEGFRDGLAFQEMRNRTTEVQAGLLGRMVQMENQNSLTAIRNQKQAAWLEDVPKIQAWASLPFEQRVNTPAPTLTSEEGIRLSTSMARADSTSVLAKTMTQARATYDKRVAAVVSTDPAWASKLVLPGNQFPDGNSYEYLALAEQSVKAAKDAATEKARIAAEIRGDQVSTTIAPDGKITERFTPAKPSDDAGGELEQIELKNGQLAVRVPGSKSLHVLKNNGQELAAKVALVEYQAILKEYNGSSESKRTKLKAQLDAAKAEVSKFYDTIKDDAPAAKPTAASVKVRKYNPATGEIE
jgi:hypothetical protein